MEKEAVVPSFKNMFKTMDLTKGSIFKALFYFSLPLFLSSLITSAFGLINSLVLKYTVGGDAVTAINVTGSISSLLFNFAFGAVSGFSTITANYFGSKNSEGCGKSIYHSLYISLVVSLVISAIGFIFLNPMIAFLNIDEVYIADAKAYFVIILAMFPLTMLNNLLAAEMRSLGNSFFPLLVSIIQAGINVVFALLFTGPASMGVRGAAFASLIACSFAIAIYIVYILLKYPVYRPAKKYLKIDWQMIWSLLKLGLPLGFQWSILFIGSFIQSSVINQFGSGAASKANVVSMNYENYISMVVLFLGNGLLTFVAQNYGANKIARIRKAIQICWVSTMVLWVATISISMFIIPYISYVFLPRDEVTEQVLYYVNTYCYIISFCLVLQGSLRIFRSVLQGIKKSLWPLLSGIGELGARALVCLLLPGHIDPANPTSNAAYVGVAFSNPSAWLASTLIMGFAVLYFVTKGVLKKETPDKKTVEEVKEENKEENSTPQSEI